MRYHLTAAALTFLMASWPTAGGADSGGLDESAIDDADEMVIEEADPAWNRWICRAYARHDHVHPFIGFSKWFRGGSGEGQAAHRYAYKRALWKCQRSMHWGCESDFYRDCEVQRRD